MDNPHAGVYRVGDTDIDVSLGCLRRGGDEIHLRPRTLQVLLYLIEQRHRLVTRDELFTRFWPDTAVTDDALAQCLVEIRRALGDSFREPRVIRTLPKAGFRFIAEVEALLAIDLVATRDAASSAATTITVDEEQTTEIELIEEHSLDIVDAPLALPPAPFRARRPRTFWLVAMTAAILITGIVAAAGWRLTTASRTPALEVTLPSVPGKTPVVVMYFTNQSKRADVEWLREGLADMLIANLSRASQLAVLSRQELQLVLEKIGHAADNPIDLTVALEVARRSRAATVALGTFATFGDTIQINVQLHETVSGRVRATETVTVEAPERTPARLDALSIKVAAHLGGSISPSSSDRVTALPVMTNDLEAYRYYSLAIERAKAFDPNAAIALFEKAVAIDPEFAMAHARIGWAHAVTGFQADRGRPHLERAYRLSSRLTEKDRWLITAWHAIASLDYPRAVESMRQIVANYPAETDAYLRLGLLLRGEDRPREAIEVIERALAFAPDDDEAWRELGIVHLEAGDPARALAALTRAVALAPNEAVSHERLGTAFRWMGRYEEAAASYRRVLALSPTSSTASLGLGHLAYAQGRYRDAVAQYGGENAAVGPNTGCASQQRSIGRVYLKLGDLDRAGRAADEALGCDPTAYWTAVLVARQRGERAKVRQLAQRVDIGPPPDRGFRPFRRFQAYERGMLALWDGRGPDAVNHFKQALRHRPPFFDFDSLEDCLANAYLDLGRLDEAIAEYQRVLRINPNHALSRYHLGQALERKGLRAEAREEIKRFLAIWKDADANIPELQAARPLLETLTDSR